MIVSALMIAMIAAQPAKLTPPRNPVGTVVKARGNGNMSCATAFLQENRLATENWIAGHWAAWDMAMMKVAEPVAASADLNGIVGEVEVVCRAEPSTTLLFAVIDARKKITERWSKIR